MMEKSLAVFEDYKIRRVYDEESETWYFSVVDIIQVLIQQPDYQAARNYWKVLKNRLNKEGSETVTKCNRLKMVAEDGKMRLTDVADPETLLRLIQSVPSPKAEPIKLWLAKVGYERMQDMADPERSLDRAREYWHQHGRSEKWIQQRMMGQETRNKLTDYWKGHEITKEEEYAILTNIIHQEWADVSVKKHKKMKGLKTQNLRDHMSEAELIFTALAELSTRQIAETMNAVGMDENKVAGKKGGRLSPDLVFRDPYFFDFLGLKDRYLEKDLEDAILRELEQFILELGAGFSFIARQKRIQVDSDDYYIDLLFYNRRLRRLVAIDLKIGDFKPADKGQMELYLRWLDKYERQKEEAAPVGLIPLCREKA